MRDKSLLLRIRQPASVELCERLPDFLEDGARGGFHPCGMWDYICDSKRLDWCGILFYLSSAIFHEFESSNIGMDPSMMRLRKINEVFDDKVSLDRCAENGTSHALQVIWSEPASIEIMPALEFSDCWYASSGNRKIDSVEDCFSSAYKFSALGIGGFEDKLNRIGLDFPQHFLFPFIDRS